MDGFEGSGVCVDSRREGDGDSSGSFHVRRRQCGKSRRGTRRRRCGDAWQRCFDAGAECADKGSRLGFELREKTCLCILCGCCLGSGSGRRRFCGSGWRCLSGSRRSFSCRCRSCRCRAASFESSITSLEYRAFAQRIFASFLIVASCKTSGVSLVHFWSLRGCRVSGRLQRLESRT